MGVALSADPVEIPAVSAVLHADVKASPRPLELVIFAHGGGSIVSVFELALRR